MPGFATLWNNHPTVTREAPLLDRRLCPHQCAVRLHAALERSGVDFSSFPGLLSAQEGRPPYAIRAHELAEWLDSDAAPLDSKAEMLTGAEVFGRIDLLTGIAYFRHFWGPDKQGSHIDLWNGERLTGWTTWLQVHARVGRFGLRSDFRGSECIWFWRIL